MSDLAVTVVLEASSGEQSRVPAVMTLFTPGARARRAAGVFGISMLMAAALIPVPIVHLVGIPLVLGIGIMVALRQATSVARLDRLQIACPKCGMMNSVGGGLGYRTSTGPIDRPCESCRRLLTMRFEPRASP